MPSSMLLRLAAYYTLRWWIESRRRIKPSPLREHWSGLSPGSKVSLAIARCGRAGPGQGTLVQMARAANEGGEFWYDHLPFLLFSYHATPHRITGMSPAMLLYGRSLRLPAQRDDLSGGSIGLDGGTSPAIEEAVAQEHSASDAYTSSNTTISFAVDDTVCYRLYDVQKKLTSSWFGPCRVTKVLPRGNYMLGDFCLTS
jgi:hypothetical protein